MFSPEKDKDLFLGALREYAKTQTDPKKIERLLEPGTLEKLFSGMIQSATPGAADDLLKELKRTAPAMLRERRAVFRGFEQRLFRSWRKPLDLLETLIVISAEAGETFSKQWPWRESKDEDLVFDVLRRLHARGCQVSHEVLALLKAGHASGAHARWRALHETNVTAMFIGKHGKETAERYLLHEHIEAYKAAIGLQKHHKALKERAIPKSELDRMAQTRQGLIGQFGKAFDGSYGWAAAALGRSDKGVTFADLEPAVGLDHWRPYYKMASYPVHANPKAITFSLGLRHRQKLLLTGPSNLGLADPGHGTALSLTQLTSTMLATRPSLDVILAGRVMLKLEDEIGEAFIEAHRSLESRKSRKKTGDGASHS